MGEPRGVRFEAEGPVGRIVLERPEAANAFDLPAARAFGAAVDRIAEDEAIRTVTLIGEGKRFCAGGDVSSFVAAADGGRPGGTLRPSAEARDLHAVSALVSVIASTRLRRGPARGQIAWRPR